LVVVWINPNNNQTTTKQQTEGTRRRHPEGQNKSPLKRQEKNNTYMKTPKNITVMKKIYIFLLP
jgi:hypothetical protein